MNNNSIKNLGLLFAILFLGASFSIGLEGLLKSILPEKNLKASVSDAVEAAARMGAFENITLGAHAAFVLDLTTNKILFAQNENEKLPLASVTKTMTAFVARENFETNTIITLTKDDLATEGDSGLLSGEKWQLGRLLDVMMLVSSNDAAHAIARFVGENEQTEKQKNADVARLHFIQMMNEKAKALGLTSMEFFNESGLDVEPSKNGGYGSAHDVALLLTDLWSKYPSVVEITTRKDARILSENGLAHILPTTNEAQGHFAGLIASKTGYTTLAGGNLAIIFDIGIGHPVVAVVLGSTYQGRFDDMQTLVQATRKLLVK